MSRGCGGRQGDFGIMGHASQVKLSRQSMSISVVWFKLKFCLLCNQSFIVLRVHLPNIY